LMKLIDHLNAVLASDELQRGIIKTELEDIRERYGDGRRTEINYAGGEFSTEDMIADEAMVITVSREGYIKRTALDEYRTQARGGLGSRGAATKKDDFGAFVCCYNPRIFAFLYRSRAGILAESLRSARRRQGQQRPADSEFYSDSVG